MANLIQAVRGMNDILPDMAPYWQHIETILHETLTSYDFKQIRLPIVEKTELFKRTIGEATDIVEKEMYTFADRNEEYLSLRPEGTAGCVRAGIEHGLLYNQIQKLWYFGPFFRHERPQKGRYRQFYQFGAEIFGLAGPDIDAELILMSARILDKLGLSAHVELQLNTLGSSADRANYRVKLVDYLNDHRHLLDEDSLRRLQTNPLRILDSKNPEMAALLQDAPKLIDCLDDESTAHFELLQTYLQNLKIRFKLNPCLVRGLDYYSKTVFEWVTTDLGAQGTVCAGGRYDALVQQLGGKATPALGFAMGIERLILLLSQMQKLESAKPHIYIISDSSVNSQKAMQCGDLLRQAIPQLRLSVHHGGGSIKNQFKRADKSGAEIALIFAENEVQLNVISVKFLREKKPQLHISTENMVAFVKDEFFPEQ